jgi:effector-binding domain-containing protein
VEEEHDRLSRLQSRIRLIEQETSMSQEVVLKQLPKQWVASVRETIANYPAVGALYPRVIAGVGPGAVGQAPCFTMWHDPEFRESDVDGEAGIFLREPIAATGNVRVYELAAATVASAIHAGSYQRLQEAYDALLRWVGNNGYQVSGPIRELYLQNSQPVRQDDESYITEIQVPVTRAA